MNRILKIAVPVLVILAVLYWMPFITVNIETGGAQFRVPFGYSLESNDGEKVTFRSLRSAYALEKDADNAMMAYGESKCYGKTYYYDKSNDVSYYDVETESGFPSRVSYLYESGNACLGWTEDDEIAWPYGDPMEVDLSITPEEAMALENPWFVIVDGVPQNEYVFNEFSRNFKQGVCSYFRTMIVEGNEKSLIDIQLLTPENGAFYIRTRNADWIEEGPYPRVSEIEMNGEVWMAAFAKNSSKAEAIPLFRGR